MAPLELVETTTYLAEISSETDENGNVNYTRTPGEVTTGFQLQLFPRVLNNREMMVQYSVQISELTQLKSFGEGNNAIQLPEISTTSFEQQAVLENGQTLILAGFERDRATTGDDAMATVGGLPVGGAKTAETSRVATVMMITPRLINRRDSISSGR
jgi:type II secretory pathway component GspD/PulD (secretin)